MSNIALAIGDTGSGKSTLLQALVRTPDAMEQREIKFMATLKNGK